MGGASTGETRCEKRGGRRAKALAPPAGGARALLRCGRSLRRACRVTASARTTYAEAWTCNDRP
eukprot:6182352-Alexandrium_andersonii.AAC.1